jgi:hypothetical protein
VKQLTKGRLDGLVITPIRTGNQLVFVHFTVDSLPGLRLIVEADAVKELHSALGYLIGARQGSGT